MHVSFQTLMAAFRSASNLHYFTHSNNNASKSQEHQETQLEYNDCITKYQGFFSFITSGYRSR